MDSKKISSMNNSDQSWSEDIDLNEFIVPSETNTESESSVSDINCEFEFLQTSAISDPIPSNVNPEDKLVIVDAMMMDGCTIDDFLISMGEQEVPQSTQDERNNSEYSNSEQVLNDWHLISDVSENYECNTSDDDSIVILEREIARPSYVSTNVDNNENTDAQNLDLMTSSLVTVDKHVQTNDGVDSDMSIELQHTETSITETEPEMPKLITWIQDYWMLIIVVLCLACLFSIADALFKDYSRFHAQSNDAVMDFMVHVVKDVNNKMEELQKNIDHIAVNRPDRIGSGKPDELKEYLKQDFAAMNTFFDRLREEGNQVFANDNALRRHIEKVRDDVYMLNVHGFQRYSPSQSSLPKSIFKLLLVVDRCAPCDATTSLTERQLPVPCRDNHRRLKLVFHRNHLVSVNLHSEVFYDMVFKKFETGADDDLSSIEESNVVPPTSTENEAEDDAFVQDCDNFSKHYRSNFCSVSPNSDDCEEDSGAGENPRTKRCPSNQPLPDDLSSFPSASSPPTVYERPISNDNELLSAIERKLNDENNESKVLRKMKEFKMLLGKFQQEFENFYRWCADSEDHEFCQKWSAQPSSSFPTSPAEDDAETQEASTTDSFSPSSSSADDSSTGETDDEDEEEDDDKEDDNDDTIEENTNIDTEKNIDVDSDKSTTDEQTGQISGEWFFNLNAARAKLRSYYDNAVSGDWILKLGKAREKFRERFGEYKRKFMKNVRSKRKNKSKNKRWYVPDSEKLKDKFKTFSASWKSHFTKVKDNFVRSYNQYVPPTWRFDENRWFFHS